MVASSRLARIGSMEYLGEEIGAETGKTYSVEVTEEELFKPDVIASFEGMPVTLLHPDGLEVKAENWKDLAVGHVQNVRRDGDFLRGDVFVSDAAAIRMIQDYGIQEISLGYDCEIVNENGKFKKTQIKGNHHAIVPSGRAGSVCRLGDKESIVSKSRTTLADGVKKLLGLLKVGDEAVSEEDKKAIETAIAELQAALAALPPETAPEEVAALEAKIAELETKLKEQSATGDAEPDDKDAEIAALKERVVELETENAELKKQLEEGNALNDRKAAIADASARFPKLKVGDAATAREVFEAVLVDAGIYTADEAKGKDITEVKAAYAGLSAAKSKPTIGRKLLSDAKTEQKADLNKRYGGK